jgi:two-component system alkaline phosphatase synthesis response regulator PhoP
MSKELIYCVEDEVNIQQLIKYNLELNGYKVLTFGDGESLLEISKDKLPAMFILDIMLPGIDGIEICKRIRQNPSANNIPIIMLTAKSEEFDKVLGLELGADDYITKPFGVREFIARVKALFRRTDTSNQTDTDLANSIDIIIYGNIKIDTPRREVFKYDKLLDLTLKEFELLKLLLLNKGKVLSREQLLEKVWGFDYFGETRTVDVHIRYLRQKIEDDDSNPKLIETVRGIGYRFSDK